MIPAKPLLELELRPVAAPAHATPGAQVFVLLPSLDELLGTVGFAAAHPICLPGSPHPFSPRDFFAAHARRQALH
jgi:hypothetical protein